MFLCIELDLPLRIIPALHLEIVRIQRSTQACILDELGPINTKPALHSLPMSRRYCKVRWLLVQEEDIVMGMLGILGRRSRPEV